MTLQRIGLTSETTSGTSSDIRQRDELSITVAPARELRRPLSRGRPAGREEREIEALDCVLAQLAR